MPGHHDDAVFSEADMVWHTPIFPSTNPLSRTDPVLLGMWLDEMVEHARGLATEKEERTAMRQIAHICFNEVVRQESQVCRERANVMERLWGVIMTGFGKTPYRDDVAEIARLKAELAGAQAELDKERRRRVEEERGRLQSRERAAARDAGRDAEVEGFNEALRDLDAARDRIRELEDTVAERDSEVLFQKKHAGGLEKIVLSQWGLAEAVRRMEAEIVAFNARHNRPTAGGDTGGKPRLFHDEKEEDAARTTRAVTVVDHFVAEALRVRGLMLDRLGREIGDLEAEAETRNALTYRFDFQDVACQTDEWWSAPPDPEEDDDRGSGDGGSDDGGEAEAAEPAAGDAVVTIPPKARRKRARKANGDLSHMLPSMAPMLRAIKGKGRLRSLRWLQKYLAAVYVEKFWADMVCDREGKPRPKMPGFLWEHTLNKFGLQKIAEQTLLDLVVSLDHYKSFEESHIVRTFMRLIDDDSMLELNLYLHVFDLARSFNTGLVGVSAIFQSESGSRLISERAALEIARVGLLLSPERATRFAAKLARLKEDPPPSYPRALVARERHVVDFDAFMFIVIRELNNIRAANGPQAVAEIERACFRYGPGPGAAGGYTAAGHLSGGPSSGPSREPSRINLMGGASTANLPAMLKQQQQQQKGGDAGDLKREQSLLVYLECRACSHRAPTLPDFQRHQAACEARREALALLRDARPALGVKVETVAGREAVLVLAVDAGGTGAEAGIEVGNLITHVDGQVVATAADFKEAVQSKKPGEHVTLTRFTGNRRENRAPQQINVAVGCAGLTADTTFETLSRALEDPRLPGEGSGVVVVENSAGAVEN